MNKLYYPAIGGIEKVVQQIAEGLKTEVDMSVLVCQSKGKGVKEDINQVPVIRCGSLGTLFSVPISVSFLWQLRKQAVKKDILHFHAPFPLGDLACILSGYKGKIVLYWHSDVVKQKRLMFLYRPIMESFLKRVDVIIVAADGVMSGSSYLKPYIHKCITIPFAIDPEFDKRGKAYLKTAVENDTNYVRFLFVGRLVYYKGIDILLKAFAEVENAELTIIGDGEMKGALVKYAESHKFLDRIRFLGSVSNDVLHHEFAACDVFVLPSVLKSEAFGLVQQEAMAYGKAVINTNLPSGVPEVSLHQVTGLTVEPGDVISLREAMQWLVDHPRERNLFGKNGRDRIEGMYTLDKILPRIYSVYVELMSQKG